MKYSYKWLKELSGTKKDSRELMEMVGLKGFELEGFENLEERFTGFVVGEILEFKAHPNADNLRLVKVGLGEDKEVQIVCGAANFEVSDKIPVALVDAVVPVNKLKIKKVKLRGEFSEGMLCSEEELGLGKDSKGIMILNKDLQVGMPLAKALEFDDIVVDFDILPNRAHDCLNHIGMAREIAAMEGRKMEEVYSKLPEGVSQGGIAIDIENPEICSRYIGAVLEDIVVAPSPSWIQTRLIASGMEPINNVVDITNYVMLEVGNPLHAFDFNNIANKDGLVEIVVRKAKEKEKMVLLDGKELELDQADLVIANKEQALALAGIKGGLHSGVATKTTKLVLEAANFKGYNIRKTRQRQGLLTESQSRFEKNISPRLAEFAAARAVELLQKYANAKLVALRDADFSQQETKRQDFNFDYARGLLGTQVSDQKMCEVIANLGFKLEKQGTQRLEVSVPFWRLDIEGQADLVEEIGRIIGYGQIEAEAVVEDIAPAKINQSRKFEWKLIDRLNGLGFDEVRLYSFYSQKDAENCGIRGDHFEMENPLSAELALMRKSLTPNLLRAVGENAKYFSEVAIFELGREYHQAGADRMELGKLAAAYLDLAKKDTELFFELKGRTEALLAGMVEGKLEFIVPSKWKNKIYHRTRSAEIVVAGEVVGILGQASKAVAKKFGIKKPVVLVELDIEKLRAKIAQEKIFQPIAKFPVVLRDLSMFVEYQRRSVEVQEIIEKVAGKLLKEIELFDVYEDRESNKKSLAFHLRFSKQNATLESEEVDGLMSKIVLSLEKQGVQVRTK